MPPATTTTWPVTWPESFVGGEDDDLAGDVLGLGDFRSAIVAVTRSSTSSVDRAPGHRRIRPAGADSVDARARRDTDDLVLQAQQQSVDWTADFAAA